DQDALGGLNQKGSCNRIDVASRCCRGALFVSFAGDRGHVESLVGTTALIRSRRSRGAGIVQVGQRDSVQERVDLARPQVARNDDSLGQRKGNDFLRPKGWRKTPPAFGRRIVDKR